MDSGEPVIPIRLRAASLVDDLSFVALADVAEVLSAHPVGAESRLIGGLMMTLHAHRWDLGSDLVRETLDVDIGMPRLAARLFEDIDLALEQLGYRQAGQYRYRREVADVGADEAGHHEAIIDLVQVGAMRADAEPAVAEGSGDLDPTAIAEALHRPAVGVDLHLTRMNGSVHELHIQLADEPSALMLKAYAFRARRLQRDAYDVWRALEIARPSQVSRKDFESPAGQTTTEILRSDFGTIEGQGVQGLKAYFGTDAPPDLLTRITALVDRLF